MKKVLIINDAAYWSVPLQEILVECGFEVVGEAANTENGVKMYRRLRPDIVFLNITLPGLSGIVTLQKLKVINPDARIIVLSHFGQEQEVREAMTAGAVAFLIQPFQNDIATKELLRRA